MNESISKFIKEYDVKLVSKNTLSLDGENCRSSFKLKPRECKSIQSLYFPEIDAVEIPSKVFTHCINYLNSEEAPKKREIDTNGEILGFGGDIFDLKIISPCNVARTNKIVAVDYKNMKINHKIVSKDVLTVIREILDDELWQQWRWNNYSFRVTEYKPHIDKLFYKDDDYLYLNTYVKPEYQKKVVEGMVYPEPKMFLELMKQVFPIVEQREVVEEFMYYCVANIRAKQAIVAVGRQGCGKGTTFNRTLGALVGRTNHYSLANSFADSAFDSGIRGHTVVFADELDFKKKKVKNKFKNLIGNNVVTIEEKHVSAHESEEIYANFIFASNYLKDFFVEIEDRLFLYPEMSDEKLEVALGDAWVKEYIQLLEDPEFLKPIHSYLYKKFGHLKTSRIMKMESQNEIIALHRNDHLYRRAFLRCCYFGDPTIDYGEEASYFKLRNVREEMRDIKGNSEKGLPHIQLDEVLIYLQEYKKRFGRELAVYEQEGKNRRFKSLVYKDDEFGKLVR